MKIPIYLEIGKKRTFAGALDWYGWARSARDEESALQSLLDYAPRYSQVISRSRLGFQIPRDLSAFQIVERLRGTTTTDFGSPDIAPSVDADPVRPADLKRLQTILKACWRAFDTAADQAKNKPLTLGARGGGRDLEKIRAHVLDGERGYLYSLGGRVLPPPPALVTTQEMRQAILKTLIASARGELPAFGPRGGKRWSPRYFTRREAWHILDHLWEIQDRIK